MSELDNLSVEELRVLAGYDIPTKEKSLRERLDIDPGDINKAVKLVFGEIHRHKKPKKDATLRERISGENPEEDLSKTVRNIASVMTPFGVIRGASQIGNIVKEKAAATAKRISDNSKISRLQRNPTLKKKVLEKLSNEAGAQKFGSVPNQEAGKLAIKSGENYKDKAEKAFEGIFGRSKSHLEKHTAGKSNPNRLINPDKAIDFGKKQLDSLESSTLRREWLDSAPGQQYQQLVKLKSAMGGVPIGDAEHLRRAIGNKTSKAGAMGNLEQGELRHMSGLLKGEIGQKYKEAGNQAYRHWERSHKHYTLHKKNNAPKTNEILKLSHEPEAAFAHATKDIKTGASNLKHTSQYLKGKEREDFHRGVVFDLGKKADKWDAAAFHKNFAELPAKNKRLILDKMSQEDRKNIWALRKRLKTMNLHEGKKSAADIGQEFLPHWAKRLVTEPIKTLRHNNYLKPEHVSRTTEALKRKAHPSKNHEGTKLDYKTIPGLTSIFAPQSRDIDKASIEELRKIAGYD